jgi:hypothetical protein
MNRRAFIGTLVGAPVAAKALRKAETLELWGPAMDWETAEKMRLGAEAYYGRPCTLTRANLNALTPAQIEWLIKPT